jgi:outer membrane protein OmpA-like peptidoglycan-associated protein
MDACPDEPGPKDDDPVLNGCPPRQQVIVHHDAITIMEQIKFAVDSDVILAASDGLMTEIAKVLNEHSTIKKVRIEGHTDATGPHDHNMRLSQRRAESVVKWLVAHGVDASRLEAQGFGPDQPLQPNNTAEGRKENRRVEFKILEQELN